MTAQAEITRPNPYVGPRPFRTRDRAYFFGRERETIDLRDLLIARRVVLLFSPSGAGKTSLLQAGVIPDMCALGYTVYAPLRVSSEIPTELSQDPPPNRYLFSTLVSLEETLPEIERLPIGELAGMNLVDYLDQKRARMICEARLELDIGQVLIFDQFEELLSLNPADVSEKQAFLKSLAPVVADPQYFALFSMREDYVASMDPYLRLIPDRLATRYRVGLLSEQAALEAVRKPSRQVQPPVDFHLEAAEELISDLRQILLRQVDGPPQLTEGPYIEPIMLQVVCHGLWNKRRYPEEITVHDLHQLRRPGQEWLGDLRGDPDLARMTPVDLSLGSYYASKVAEVARNDLPVEHKIRDWFDSQLISTQDLRSIVLQGVKESQGLDNSLIAELVHGHLVRAEPRRGLVWYELIHDRFIEPVRQNNASWFKEKLKPLQRQALLWEREGRQQNLLLRGQPLMEAETWVEKDGPDLTLSEQDLLNASQEAVAVERRELRRLRIFVVVVAVLALLAGGLAIYSNSLSNQAKQNESRALNAETGALALSTESKQNESDARTAEADALIAEANALDLSTQAAEDRSAAILSEATATAALADAVAGRATADAALELNISKDATAEAFEFAAQEAQGQAQEWLARKLASEALALAPTNPDLAALLSVEAYCAADSFDARSALLAILQADGTDGNGLIDVQPSVPLYTQIVGEYSTKGRMVSLGWDSVSEDGGLFGLLAGELNWTLVKIPSLEEGPAQWETIHEAETIISSATFSQDGRYLALGQTSESIAEVWELSPELRVVNRVDYSTPGMVELYSPIRSLAFEPEGPGLVAGLCNFDKYVPVLLDYGEGLRCAESQNFILLRAVPSAQHWELNAHSDYIDALAYDPLNRYLASGGRDWSIIIWELLDSEPSSIVKTIYTAQPVIALAWSPDGQMMATSFVDGSIQLYHVPTMLPLGTTMRSPDGEINSLIFNEANGLITSSGSGALLSWLSTPYGWSLRACESAGRILSPEEWEDYLRDEPYAPACQNLETHSGATDDFNICGN